MGSQQKKLEWKDALRLFVGATFLALALKYVFDPVVLVIEGVPGLAIIAHFAGESLFGFPVPLWLPVAVLNLPIFLFAGFVEGISRISRSILSWCILSVELAVLPDMPTLTENLLLVAIYGGLLFGAGTAVLLSSGASIGGTRLLAESLQHLAEKADIPWLRKIRPGPFASFLDGCVVVLGAVVFNLEHMLFAALCMYLIHVACNHIVSRGRKAKMALIISEENEMIAEYILDALGRGVTSIQATGMYEGRERSILFCVCSREEIAALKETVRRIDRRAFMVIGSVGEALGEGFIENWR